MGGGKFLVLRNPHNRNREWSGQADDPAEPRAAAHAGQRPSLHRLTSLQQHNLTDWPERKLKDERASNVFLFRLEEATAAHCTFTSGSLLFQSQ